MYVHVRTKAQFLIHNPLKKADYIQQIFDFNNMVAGLLVYEGG